VATLFGAVIGIDREVRNQSAGLRTHMLTSAAAALFAIITLEMYHEVREDSGERIAADPIRVGRGGHGRRRLPRRRRHHPWPWPGARPEPRVPACGSPAPSGSPAATGRFTIALIALVLVDDGASRSSASSRSCSSPLARTARSHPRTAPRLERNRESFQAKH
jgi:hypothetical protein